MDEPDDRANRVMGGIGRAFVGVGVVARAIELVVIVSCGVAAIVFWVARL